MHKGPTISVICHLFYPEIANQLVQKLEVLSGDRTRFFINIQGGALEDVGLEKEIRAGLKNVHIMTAPEKGRDIGSKLLLIDLLLRLNVESDYTLIIHDKNSPHLENSQSWREELFKIIHPKYLKRVFEEFEKNLNVGVIGSQKYIQNEYDEESRTFLTKCDKQLQDSLKRHKISVTNYDFVAGNIFWIRTQLLKSFFESRPIMEIRTDLESGNQLDFRNGTYVHSWERIMSWIASSQNYSIYGI